MLGCCVVLTCIGPIHGAITTMTSYTLLPSLVQKMWFHWDPPSLDLPKWCLSFGRSGWVWDTCPTQVWVFWCLLVSVPWPVVNLYLDQLWILTSCESWTVVNLCTLTSCESQCKNSFPFFFFVSVTPPDIRARRSSYRILSSTAVCLYLPVLQKPLSVFYGLTCYSNHHFHFQRFFLSFIFLVKFLFLGNNTFSSLFIRAGFL